jgi:hypothetical protein
MIASGFYRLLEDVDFVRVETPYGQSAWQKVRKMAHLS